MPLDTDYLAASYAIKELNSLLSDIPHGNREQIANDIEKFVDEMKKKYKLSPDRRK